MTWTLEQLIDSLRRPEAYPDRDVDEVEVEQTHISVVFLAGDRAYKVKKPVDLGFVDYSSLERRRHFCEEEVRLNRRLAPRIYRGVVPIVESDDGLRVGGADADDAAFENDERAVESAVERAVEWAVEMVRLSDDRRLDLRVERDEIEPDRLREIGRRVADFHEDSEVDGEEREYAAFERVAENARDNFEESRDQVGTTVHEDVFERLESRTDARLERHRDRIERRAARGPVCETHGDLRLEHVYLFPEREPPEDLAIVDCIEFNEAFRYADPVADIAFTLMDLHVRGRRDLAEAVASAYFERRDDPEGGALLDFYVAYRAAVRGKVHGMKAAESEVPAEERRRAVERSRPHWLQALVRLEPPERRPCLVLVAGLPGTGKSTVAGALKEEGDFNVVDSDVVRKELAGVDPEADASSDWGEGLYTEERTRATYEEARRRAAEALFRGERVCVDATFSDRERRRPFVELAVDYGVPLVVLHCRLDAGIVRERIEAREGDPSDADWEIFERVRENWDDFDDATDRFRVDVSTAGSVEETRARALDALEDEDLA